MFATPRLRGTDFLSLTFPSDGPPHLSNSFIIIEADRKIDRHSPMFIIISSDTKTRYTSPRDERVSPRLWWTLTHEDGPTYIS